VNHRVLDGYDTLASHIATGLRVEHGFTVQSVEWDERGVRVTGADGRSIDAAAAVSTMPHGVLASGSVRFEPGLPDRKRQAIERIATGAVTKVLLVFDEPFWPARMTQLVCGDGPVTLYWPTGYRAADGDGSAVLSAYATGPRARALSEAGADAAVERVLDDLCALYPEVPVRRLVRETRVVDWLTDPFAHGGYTFLPPGAVGARADLAAADTGRLFWAGSATHWRPVADTVEAAFLSGLRAARQVSVALSA
jgi:monoamine oxidase